MVLDIVLAKHSLCSYVFSTEEFEKNKEIEKVSHER